MRLVGGTVGVDGGTCCSVLFAPDFSLNCEDSLDDGSRALKRPGDDAIARDREPTYRDYLS